MALVANRDQDLEEARRQLLRIGFDDIRGVTLDLADGEGDLVAFRLVDTTEFAAAAGEGTQILDTRVPDEWDTGVIEGSVLQCAPDVAQNVSTELDAERQVYVAYGTGYRATIAASFLEKEEFDPVVLVDAGVTEVLSALSNG